MSAEGAWRTTYVDPYLLYLKAELAKLRNRGAGECFLQRVEQLPGWFDARTVEK